MNTNFIASKDCTTRNRTWLNRAMTPLTAALLGIPLYTLSGCAVDTNESRDEQSDTFSKDDARAIGKADGIDYCEEYEWYNDGTCDSFCLTPDPDCASEPGSSVIVLAQGELASVELDDFAVTATVAFSVPCDATLDKKEIAHTYVASEDGTSTVIYVSAPLRKKTSPDNLECQGAQTETMSIVTPRYVDDTLVSVVNLEGASGPTFEVNENQRIAAAEVEIVQVNRTATGTKLAIKTKIGCGEMGPLAYHVGGVNELGRVQVAIAAHTLQPQEPTGDDCDETFTSELTITNQDIDQDKLTLIPLEQ